MLPAAVGERVLNSAFCRRVLGFFTGGRQLNTTSVWVFSVLYLLAGMRRFRRGMLGFRHEHRQIDRWLAAIISAEDRNTARALAECGRLVKGYGDTRFRTSSQMGDILDRVESSDPGADKIIQLLNAALSDDEGETFAVALQPDTSLASA